MSMNDGAARYAAKHPRRQAETDGSARTPSAWATAGRRRKSIDKMTTDEVRARSLEVMAELDAKWENDRAIDLANEAW
jgi:hypothetical protein